jgi:hypothetical protein
LSSPFNLVQLFNPITWTAHSLASQFSSRPAHTRKPPVQVARARPTHQLAVRVQKHQHVWKKRAKNPTLHEESNPRLQQQEGNDIAPRHILYVLYNKLFFYLTFVNTLKLTVHTKTKSVKIWH